MYANHRQLATVNKTAPVYNSCMSRKKHTVACQHRQMVVVTPKYCLIAETFFYKHTRFLDI